MRPKRDGDPSGHRNHDAVGDQVAGDHPGDLVDAGGEAALHMRQRDVDDRGVEDFEHRAEHHGQRDQPLVCWTDPYSGKSVPIGVEVATAKTFVRAAYLFQIRLDGFPMIPRKRIRHPVFITS